MRMCVYVSEFVCVCNYNSHACYRWIVNDSCLFSVSVRVFLFWSCMCQVVCVCVRLCVYMIIL